MLILKSWEFNDLPDVCCSRHGKIYDWILDTASGHVLRKVMFDEEPEVYLCTRTLYRGVEFKHDIITKTKFKEILKKSVPEHLRKTPIEKLTYVYDIDEEHSLYIYAIDDESKAHFMFGDVEFTSLKAAQNFELPKWAKGREVNSADILINHWISTRLGGV